MADILPLSAAVGQQISLAERLEGGELICFTEAPFSLPIGAELDFLFEQQQSAIHKNISFDPGTGRLSGLQTTTPAAIDRLRSLLRHFGAQATNWLCGELPHYAQQWRRDRITFRPIEEATRRLRLTARNDLLHVDAFATRPSDGDRILRFYANVNQTEPRVWVTSDSFAVLFDKFAHQVGLLRRATNWRERLDRCLATVLPKTVRRRSAYDDFMLRFHHFLKANDRFQEHSRKRYWQFPPNSVWLHFGDAASHAVLRGRFALDHSFFVPQSCLALADQAPASIFARACASAGLSRAA